MKEYLNQYSDGFFTAVKTFEGVSTLYVKFSVLDYTSSLYWTSADTGTEPPVYIKDIVNKK